MVGEAVELRGGEEVVVEEGLREMGVRVARGDGEEWGERGGEVLEFAAVLEGCVVVVDVGGRGGGGGGGGEWVGVVAVDGSGLAGEGGRVGGGSGCVGGLGGLGG